MRRIVATMLIALVSLGNGLAHSQLVDMHGNQRDFLQEIQGQDSDNILPSSDMLATVSVDPQFLYFVKHLDDPDYVVREEARQWLVNKPRDRMQLYAILDREELTPEQRWRMLAIAREHVLSTPRGALGIQMGQLTSRNKDGIEIVVNALLPGLPAEHVMEIGDRITHVDGEPLNSREDLAFKIQQKRPGEIIHLAVSRPVRDDDDNFMLNENDEPIYNDLEIDVILGSYELINQPGQQSQPSRMDQSLLRTAIALTNRYRPDSRLLLADVATTEFFSAGPSANDIDHYQLAVDHHAAIQNLLRQIRLMNEGKFQPETVKKMRSIWNDQLKTLILKSSNPKLTPDEQLYLKRVSDRYLELMKQ